MIRVALFASGQGSNALNLLKAAESLPSLEIPLVIVDQKSSPLPEQVSKLYQNVEVAIVPKPPHPDANEAKHIHELIMLDILKKHQIQWCFLAGYMRIVGPLLLTAFSDGEFSRIVNIHPSLLPAYPGLHAYENAFAANELRFGATVHLVDQGVDTGPIILQRSYDRLPADTLETIRERGKALEWSMYADVLKSLHDRGNLTALSRNQ